MDMWRYVVPLLFVDTQSKRIVIKKNVAQKEKCRKLKQSVPFYTGCLRSVLLSTAPPALQWAAPLLPVAGCLPLLQLQLADDWQLR